jgi:serine/threonine-protein kinase
MFERGSTFDRYTIEALLGEGGMGTVYRAYDTKLQRSVALKLLHGGPGDSAEAQQHANARLLREARAAAALSHANAVAVYDVGEKDGTAYISMELVEGRSLRAAVGDPALSTETRVAILADVARALGAAHRRGLMHRDIKPENVMIRADGQVKVLDFGLARAFREEAPTTRRGAEGRGPLLATLSRDGLIAGTPRYMAPEQLRGEPQDARADQFSWGVMAYEVLAGRPPWPGETASLTLVLAVMDDEPPPLSQADPRIPENVARVVSRAMQKAPADRYPSMDDVLVALGERPAQVVLSVDTHPVLGSARTVRASQVTTRGAPRRRRLVVPALLVLAALAIAGARVVMLRGSSPPGPSSVAAAISASQQPTSILDAPMPASEISEARAAYASGLHSLREGSIVHAVEFFVRATELDPSMAAAHLRVIVYGAYTDAANPHEHFARARELRERLSERDQAILWAYEPWYLATPPDVEGLARRARETAERWPLDAEIQLLATMHAVDTPAEIAGYERVLSLDPQFVLALMRLSNAHLLVGNYDGALGALDRCLAIAPSSNGCLSARITAYEELGRCADMERDARLMASTSPSLRSHDWVARALLATGAPLQAVRAALALKWSAAKEGQRDATRRRDEMHLAVLQGDLAAAEIIQRRLEAEVADDPTEDAHAGEVVPHVELLLEMGRSASAAELASGYLKARPAWKSADAWSPLPEMLAVAARGGLLPEAEREAARAAWLRQWDEIQGPLHLQSWILGYAIPASTGPDALAALESAPSPLPRVHSNQFHREGLEANGRVLLLAGRAPEAVPYLRRAAASCAALQAPLEHTHAELHLGQALEETGDTPGACEAYRVVLDRWGSARPRSVAAEIARGRWRAICH